MCFRGFLCVCFIRPTGINTRPCTFLLSFRLKFVDVGAYVKLPLRCLPITPKGLPFDQGRKSTREFCELPQLQVVPA